MSRIRSAPSHDEYAAYLGECSCWQCWPAPPQEPDPDDERDLALEWGGVELAD